MATMTTEPLVSFLISCYNLPTSMLRQCIESILALSLQPSEREIILIDDGSEASPLSSLGTLADALIYIRQENQGLSAARNTAIRMASGKYIQFLDGDDCLLREPYEHCLDIVRKNDADMVMFDFTHHPDVPTTFGPSITTRGTDYMRQHNIRGSACCYLFKHSILGELRFTLGIFHEDEEFTPLLLLRVETLYITDAKAYFYRQRTESIVTTTDEKKTRQKLDDTRDILCRLNQTADRLPIQERTALQRRVAQLTMAYIYNIIMQTRSQQCLNSRIEELRQMGLFPLPNREYTTKYKWFRIMTSNKLGLKVLLHTLPFIQKER